MPQRTLSGVFSLLTLILLGTLSAQFLEGQRAEAQSGSRFVENEIMTYEEALTGTPGRMIPIPQPARQVSLIDAGTADAIRGMENLLGPFLGNAPDAGAYELGLGVPWTGPRSFTNLLAYGLPQGWQVSSLGNLGNYTSLGTPSSVPGNDFRLLLTRSNPSAFILVTFDQMQGDARWNRLDAILGGQGGDTELVKRVSFRDGLDGRIVRRGGNAQFLGGRVDDEGVLNVLGGIAASDLSRGASEAGLTLQDDFFTFFRSLQYAWYLQDPQNPTVTLSFVTPPAPGVTPAGTDAAASTSNAVSPGKLHGDVTLTNASIIWDVEGDADLDATATVQFRRQGTTQWRDALDVHRINFNDARWSGGTGQTRNRLIGSIFSLSPGTTYEVRVAMADPDGGGETRTTTFTTAQVTKPFQGGRRIEVRPDNVDAVVSDLLPGDTVLLHAGNYDVLSAKNPGTREKPILFRPFGDGEVIVRFAGVASGNTWFDDMTVVGEPSGEFTGGGGYNIALWISTKGVAGAVAVTRSRIKNSYMLVYADASDPVYITDNTLTGATGLSKEGIEFGQRARGAVAAFNDITKASDGVSYGDGSIDVHNNQIHDVSDDHVEPDYAWDNYRIWENMFWKGGPAGFSHQPMKGGPWYIFRNQDTGTTYELFKMESGSGPMVVVANAFVSNREIRRIGSLFEPGSVFANNYWKAVFPGDVRGNIGENNPPAPDPGLVRLWGYNRYDVNPCSIWNWWGSLENAQAQGAEKNTRLVNAAGCTGGGGGGGGGGGNQAPTANAQNVVARQNGSVAIQLSGSDPEGTNLTFALVSGQGPSNGTLSSFDAATGKVTYAPKKDFSGPDSFAFTVSDGTSVGASAVVSIKVIVPVPVKKEGLAGHWKFDETIGGVAADASDRKNDGILKGGPAWVAGRIGGALEFDGADDYVDLGESAGLGDFGDLTISAWIRINVFGPNDFRGIIVNDPSTYRNFAFRVATNGQRLVLYWGTTPILGGNTSVSANVWHHVAFVRSGTTGNWTAALYVNGAHDGATTTAIDPHGGTHVTEIGRTEANSHFSGSLDDLCIFSRALSEGELLTLASGTPCSGGAQAPSESVCLQIPLKNRLREAQQDFAIAGTVEVRRPDGVVALSTIATPGSDGTLRISDVSLLGSLDATTSYTVSVKPRSHQRRVLRNVTDIKDGVCRLFPTSIVGDFNADGKITLADLVRAIKHFQKSDDAVVAEAYAGVRLSLATLVDILRNVITRGGEDE